MTMELELRPLEKADFVTLYHWLNAPHLKPFYMRDGISLETVLKKFSPRVGRSHDVNCVIATEDGQAFGYMQWYFNRTFPDYGAATIGRMAGVSIDYFIGDRNFLGRQLGSKMLDALVLQTCPDLDTQDRIFYIAHDDDNLPAIRCSTRAGFVADEAYVEQGKQSMLYVRSERCFGKQDYEQR